MVVQVLIWESYCYIGNIMSFSELRHFALFHSMSDIKDAQMNMQCILIHEFMFYEFKLGHNATEETKNNLLSERWRHSLS